MVTLAAHPRYIPLLALSGQEYLVVTPDTTFVRRRRIARLICHEISHMWYGDLVTPHSFDELWLKEVRLLCFAPWPTASHFIYNSEGNGVVPNGTPLEEGGGDNLTLLLLLLPLTACCYLTCWYPCCYGMLVEATVKQVPRLARSRHLQSVGRLPTCTRCDEGRYAFFLRGVPR